MSSALKGLTKTKSKKKKVKAFHQKVKVFRANDPKMAVLMWGVSHSISQLSHVPPPVMLLKDDFKAYSKIKIDNHFYNKENMPGHFKFKEYMPLVFRNLRERFSIDERLYARSFLIQPQFTDIMKASETKFLLTKDKTFYIKTMEREEVEMMHHMMPSYHQHIVECHSETLLPQYLGMYRTTLENKEYYYLVIRNVFSSRRNVHKKFVLKGLQTEKENKDAEKMKEIPSLKDNEFSKEYGKLKIGSEAKEFLMEKFKKDINFLGRHNILDYSLLVGVHDTERVDSEPEDELDGDDYETGEDSADGLDEPSSPNDDMDGRDIKFQRTDSIHSSEIAFNHEYYAVPCSDESMHEVYYLGLMDVLMYYGASKKAQHAAKTVKHGTKDAEHSTPKPQYYGSRFLDFIETVLE